MVFLVDSSKCEWVVQEAEWLGFRLAPPGLNQFN